MSASQFSFSSDKLKQIATDVLDYARSRGASSAETEVSEGAGQTVTARQGEVETIEYNRDKGIGVTTYVGQKRGHSSTTDFAPQAIRDAVDAALSIARFTAVDDCAGLADADTLARDIPDLDLWHPWDMPVERAIELAQKCEAAGYACDARLTNSEGATISTQGAHFIYANSLGFMAGFPSSRHGVWCSLVAGKNDDMHREDWYETNRDAAELPDVASVGRRAGERAVKRLGARKIATTQAPVLFEAPVALQLIGHFVSAVNGGNLYRKTSFLVDSLGRELFSPIVHIDERPHVPQAMASTPFDEEGVATRERTIVRAGTVEGYFLGSYSARKLGMKSTGNAGGHHNLFVRSEGPDFAGMLKHMRKGLLVTELMGQGINLVTGDYSRGAAGYWVEGGEIRFPVEEITIAGNLRDMFKGIVAVGGDVLVRSGRESGSILIENMTIAGD